MENKQVIVKETGLKYSTVGLIGLVVFVIGFVVGLGVASKVNPCVVVPTISVERDTVYTVDTIPGEIPKPQVRTITRRDTLVLPAKPDTAFKPIDTSKRDVITAPQAYELPDGSISIPIEQKVYATGLYRAVVSGWHPRLDSITVYPKTTTIRETVTKLAKPPRANWSITVGPSATYTFDNRFVPGASVVIGFVVKSWH